MSKNWFHFCWANISWFSKHCQFFISGTYFAINFRTLKSPANALHIVITIVWNFLLNFSVTVNFKQIWIENVKDKIVDKCFFFSIPHFQDKSKQASSVLLSLPCSGTQPAKQDFLKKSGFSILEPSPFDKNFDPGSQVN